MRDPDRIDDVLTELYDTWRASPDLRFGQLLENIAAHAGLSKRDWYNAEEHVWLKAIQNYPRPK